MDFLVLLWYDIYMNFDIPPQPEVNAESDFQDFIPEEFLANPLEYFEKYGRNIKSGEILYDSEGKVKEDPTAVKDLPVWRNQRNEELHTVGKKVNLTKGKVGESGDPFYEYTIMEIAKEFGLPAPIPVAKITHNNEHLVIMKKIEGIRWTDDGMKPIRDSNLTAEDKQNLIAQAEALMFDLQQKYEGIGLHRNWKLKDMVFNVDIPNRKVISVIPTDWERTKIDTKKLTIARQERQEI